MRRSPAEQGEASGGPSPDLVMRSWLFPGNAPLGAIRRGADIRVRGEVGESLFRLDLHGQRGTISVSGEGEHAPSRPLHPEARPDLCRRLFAALECAVCDPARPVSELALTGEALLTLRPDLLAMGLLREIDQTVLRDRDILAYRPGWMGRAAPARGHEAGLGPAGLPLPLPLRPPMPSGPLYARHIPWLNQTLCFTAATMEDLPRLHLWLNDPLVDRFWREAGSIDQHRAYLQRQFDDPHTIPIIARLDGVPFAYFEIYWAAESLIGPHYQADPFDRGWHVLIGEPDYRGRPFITAWLPSLMHFIFLDEPRTMRILGEPDAAHAQQLRNLERSGFDHFATVDLPTKRAALVALQRERFDRERLWLPDSIHHEGAARSLDRTARWVRDARSHEFDVEK